jgi:hypothetical protein
MKKVYVAGAYSSNTAIGVFDNMREGMRWSTKVLLGGNAPFCPWLDFHFQFMLKEGEELTVENYYDYSMEWLRASDVVFVTPNWEGSKGTIAEIAEAERLGIPVVYNFSEI